VFKILHTADSHFQSNRLDECVFNASYIVDYANKNNPDLIVHSGDLFHKNTMINSREYLSAVDFIADLSSVAPVILVRGNHDPDGSFNVFKKMPDIYAYDDFGTIEYADMDGVEYPYGIQINIVPYQRTTASESTVSKAHVAVAERMKQFLSTAINKDRTLRIVVAHVSVVGAMLANSERVLGNEVMLGINDFDGFDGALLGHIHKSDQDIFKGKPVAYSGSHYRTRFDEIMEPGFRFWTFDVDKSNKWYLLENKFVPTPARDMVQFDLDIEETKEYIGTGKFPYEINPNTDVKVVFSVPEGMGSKLKKDAFYGDIDLKKINSTVKTVTIIEPKTGVRSAKIAKLKTKTEIFQEWADVSKIKMTKTVKDKLGELIERN